MTRHVSALFAALTMAMLMLAVAIPASAQVQRNFPADALRGALVVLDAPQVMLNGAPARLAPGARIRGQNNMLAMSGSLAGHKLMVNYTLDAQGQVKEVWILTAGEAARLPWPATPNEAREWKFDAATQTWARP